MEKKIGILTFHATTNYGAVLQSFSLEKKIIELGYNCEIINYHSYIEYKELIKFPRLNKPIIPYMKDIKAYLLYRKKRLKVKEFIKQNIILSKKDYNKKNIYLANNEYDKIIVGSDMVFNLNISKGDTTYYLDFANDEKKYSYAASLGMDKIENKYLDICKKSLNSFRYLSVRELQAKDYFNTILQNDAHLDIDPTLLHDSDFWQNYEEKPSIIPNKKYIVLYFLDSEGIELQTAEKIAKEKDYQIIFLGYSKVKRERLTCISDASIGEFLYYIHHAELVITASYHGMLFSINYNTNFMYYIKTCSSRMESIVKILEIKNRKLTKEYIPEIECDFKNINNKVSELRSKSINNLKKILDEK